MHVPSSYLSIFIAHPPYLSILKILYSSHFQVPSLKASSQNLIISFYLVSIFYKSNITFIIFISLASHSVFCFILSESCTHACSKFWLSSLSWVLCLNLMLIVYLLNVSTHWKFSLLPFYAKIINIIIIFENSVSGLTNSGHQSHRSLTGTQPVFN